MGLAPSPELARGRGGSPLPRGVHVGHLLGRRPKMPKLPKPIDMGHAVTRWTSSSEARHGRARHGGGLWLYNVTLRNTHRNSSLVLLRYGYAGMAVRGRSGPPCMYRHSALMAPRSCSPPCEVASVLHASCG